jgi:hypothetical protein
MNTVKGHRVDRGGFGLAWTLILLGTAVSSNRPAYAAETSAVATLVPSENSATPASAPGAGVEPTPSAGLWEAARMLRRSEVGVAWELASARRSMFSGGATTFYSGPAFQLGYRFSPLISAGASVLVAASGGSERTEVFMVRPALCKDNLQRHGWRGTGMLKLHPNGVRTLDPWIGAEAGVVNRVDTSTSDCTAGGGSIVERQESHLAFGAGGTVGWSFRIQDVASIDVSFRALRTTSNDEPVWLVGNVALSLYFGIL